MKDYVPILFLISCIVVYAEASDSDTCIIEPFTTFWSKNDIAKNGYCNKNEKTGIHMADDDFTRGRLSFLQEATKLVSHTNENNDCNRYKGTCKYPYGVSEDTFQDLVKLLEKKGYMDNYDLRLFNTTCPSIIEISNQEGCDTCWAVASTDVMTDRLCIKTNGTNRARHSVMDLMSCCKDCLMDADKPCKNGGKHELAWIHWRDTGIVSGHYNTTGQTGCRNYHVPPCTSEVEMGNSELSEPSGCKVPKMNCPDMENEPTCNEVCDEGWKGGSYEQVKMKGKDFYILKRKFDGEEAAVKLEIVLHGPVHAIMTTYHSLYTLYSSNDVNVHEVKPYLAPRDGTPEDENCRGHSIRIVGWGKKDNTSYWIAANSWGDKWGDNGFFYLNFEHDLKFKNKGKEEIFAGIPAL